MTLLLMARIHPTQLLVVGSLLWSIGCSSDSASPESTSGAGGMATADVSGSGTFATGNATSGAGEVTSATGAAMNTVTATNSVSGATSTSGSARATSGSTTSSGASTSTMVGSTGMAGDVSGAGGSMTGTDGSMSSAGGSMSSAGGSMSGAGGTSMAAADTWDSFASDFVQSYCISCHSPGGSAASHDYGALAGVQPDAAAMACGLTKSTEDWTARGCSGSPVARQFPAGNGDEPSDEERDRMIAWIDAGMP